MRNISKFFFVCLFVVSALWARNPVDNVQFTDLDGNSYDLYQMLDKGHYVLIHMQFNG